MGRIKMSRNGSEMQQAIAAGMENPESEMGFHGMEYAFSGINHPLRRKP
jgi:hypothetical protein